MGEGHGYGKTILFGEHFVVYGLPAIAAAISARTTARVEPKDSPGIELIDTRPETPGYKKEKAAEQQESLSEILNFCNIDVARQGLRITFGGDLIAASGIGASAASSTALARALNQEFKLGFDDNRINEAAYEGEKGYHGTPSGIDNTAATFGGVIWFQRQPGQAQNIIEKIGIKEPLAIVIGNTGITSSTSKVVADVRSLREKNPARFDETLHAYSTLAADAKEALVEGDAEKVGDLMNRNQTLLREITVSSRELEKLIDTSLAEGAYGAKLTGTGRGGLMIALTPSREVQERVAQAITGKGYIAWKTQIGVQ